MKKVVSMALLGALLATSVSAGDLLSKATGGLINETSANVFKLDKKDMEGVKGGWSSGAFTLNNMFFRPAPASLYRPYPYYPH